MGYNPKVWAPYQLSLFTIIMSAILCVVTITGNSLVCVAILKDPLGKLRSPFAYFLVNLACSDLIVGGAMLPVSVVAHLYELNGYIPMSLVYTMHLTYFASATASILSLLALAIDRYFAVVSAIRYRVYFSWRRCALVSCLIWTLSLGLPLIYLQIGYINYLMVYSHTAVATAFAGLIVTYVRKKKFLKLQRSAMRSLQKTSSDAARESESRRLATEKQVTKAFLLILLLFASIYIPTVIMIYLLQFCNSCNDIVVHVLRDLQFVLISINSCMNPFVCCIRLKYYRKSIVALFPRCCQCVFSSFERTPVKEREMSAKPRSSTVISDITSEVTSTTPTASSVEEMDVKVEELKTGTKVHFATDVIIMNLHIHDCDIITDEQRSTKGCLIEENSPLAKDVIDGKLTHVNDSTLKHEIKAT